MIRRKLRKKFISGSLAMALFMSFLPTENTEAYYNVDRSTSVKSLAEKYKLELENLDGELKANPIRDGVDITSEDEQSIIVEFNSFPIIMQQKLNNGVSTYNTTNNVDEEHKSFEDFLIKKSKEKSISSYNIGFSYYNTFNGVAMKIKGTEIESLLESGVIKAIWKDETVQVEPVTTEEVIYSVDESNTNSRMISSTPLIGVDKLREEGITGEGVKVGVIDTGIDYNHPDLKDNYKGGYDFIDNDNDPMETSYEDWLASGAEEFIGSSSYYTSHGTHVSGTIAATGSNKESEFATTGLAPNVDLYVYRALGPYGSGETSGIIAAIEKSVEDGMDVINLSLGGNSTDVLEPTSVACNNASLAGVVTVVANGNAGPDFSTLGSPGCSPLSISVGASSTAISVKTFDISFSNGDIVNGRLFARNFDSLDNILDSDYEIVYAGLGSEDEIQAANVDGKVVLIDRGEITFADKLENAYNAGAIAVLIANNIENEILNIYLGESNKTVTAISITKEKGSEIKSLLENVEEGTEPIKVRLSIFGTTKTEPDLLSDFSSRGPASDETIKPDVVAPGEAIFSTYPEYINSPEEGIDYSKAYSRISGTSMATPHVAGIVALMLQNNSDLTPEEVKVTLMNTCVDLVNDYPINAVGAGRVDAYKAVHNNVSITVNDTCPSTDENYNVIDLDYLTGSLSFDRAYTSGKDIAKTLGLTIKNNSEEDKTFNISVKYLGDEALAENSSENGVYLDIPSTLTVGSSEELDFDSTINIPKNANLGRYEGYIIVSNTTDSTEEYSLPFSITYSEPGISSLTLSRYSISNDLEMMHFAKISGITATVKVSSPINDMTVFVKDYNTDERIGVVGYTDLSYLVPGQEGIFYALNSRASYFPIKDNEVENIRSSLTDGKYILEFVAYGDDFVDPITKEIPVLVDNEDVIQTIDKEPGIYEVNESMMTTEEYMGQESNAFWFHGNVDDNSINELQEMGYDVGKEDLTVTGFLNGMPYMNLAVDENGDYMVGFENSDLENGIIEFSPMPTDIATSQNLYLPPRYFLVKEGTPYSNISLDKESIKEGDNITSTISVNNLEAGSTFKYLLRYLRGFEVTDIKINDDLQKFIDENGYSLKIEKSVDGDVIRYLQLNLYLTDKEGNKVNLTGDMNLLDIKFNLVDDSESEFYREYIECDNVEVLDKDDNYANMSYKVPYEGVDIIQATSMVRTIQPGQGFIGAVDRSNYNSDLDKYIWVEDDKGNKYDLKYSENSSDYYVDNLPISTNEYKVVTDLPGHFKKEARFVPSRTLNGEIVGKVYYLLGTEFTELAYAGDVNKDDVIDIHDAIEVAKYYGTKVDYKETPVDFNFDGIVNSDDIDYIIYNFENQNEQNPQVKEAETTFEGKSLENILDEIGYYNEVRLDELNINTTSLELELNDPSRNTAQLIATMNPENVPNIEILWASRCEEIATVDKNGLVTAVNPGSTVIEVSTSDGSARLYCTVTVTKDGVIPSIESVEAVDKSLEVFVGDKFDLEFVVNPEDIVIKSITFSSSSDSIVSVVDGKGIANKVGKAIVTANINDGAAFVTWEITVKEREDSNTEEDNNENGNTNGENNGNDNENNTSGDGNTVNPTLPVNPNNNINNDKNDELPKTGGTDVLPIVLGGVILICIGLVINKKRK